MRAGKLRHRVEIQELGETRRPDGGVVEGWTTVATRWASVSPLSGRELFQAQVVDSDITHRVRMRHYTGLTTDHRLLHNSTRVLNIGQILNLDERGIEDELMCKEPTGEN